MPVFLMSPKIFIGERERDPHTEFKHLVKMLITITMMLQVQVIITMPKKGEHKNEKKKSAQKGQLM